MNVGLYSALSLASVVVVLLGLRIMHWLDCGHDGVRGLHRLYSVCVVGAFLLAVGLLHFGIFALAANFFFDVHKVLLEFYITILRPAFQAPLAHKGTALWDGV